MTSETQAPEATPAAQDEQTTAAAASAEAGTPEVPAFRFPFSPATYAPKNSDDQPWHQRGNKSNHDKRPHTPPRGTRRSMGKR